MSVEQVPPQVDQESVEIDDFLDNSMGGTSFLFYNGEVESELPLVLPFHWLEKKILYLCDNGLFLYIRFLFFLQTDSEETNVDVPSPSTRRFVHSFTAPGLKESELFISQQLSDNNTWVIYLFVEKNAWIQRWPGGYVPYFPHH